MAIYSLGDGMKRIDVSANNAKNNLPIGTVLKLNGYSDPEYVIVKNLGIDEKYGHGARYQTVSLEDGRFGQHDAYSMMHISEKTCNRIQMYYTDEVKSPEECLDLYEKAKTLQDLEKIQKDSAETVRAGLIARGKEIAAKNGIEAAEHIIVAECEKDESDSQTDYFATSTSQRVILAISKHGRDLFSEMRKAATKFDKTAHMGPGKGIFTCQVVIANPDGFKTNGSWYGKGQNSPWHRESSKTFTDKAEAEAYIKQRGPMPDIGMGGDAIATFAWEILETDIEHREKYSMGHGYYLKASNRYSSGWTVRKMGKWSGKWDDSVYISLAQICIL